MIKLVNPYIGNDGYGCYGCSPDNGNGLRMNFFYDVDAIVSEWEPDSRFMGYGGILHGGVQAGLHDEIASWVVFVIMGTAGFTQRLEMDYTKPVLIEKGPLRLKSRLDHCEGNLAFITSELSMNDGNVGSRSLAVYFTVREPIAKRKFKYPGKDAFFKKE